MEITAKYVNTKDATADPTATKGLIVLSNEVYAEVEMLDYLIKALEKLRLSL